MTPTLMPFSDEATLEDALSEPTEAAIDAMRCCPGDLMLLGVGGKMGPTLARMVKRADAAAGVERRVIGVSRFSNPAAKDKLQALGVEALTGDLLDEAFVASLPRVSNVIFMPAMKFGTRDDVSRTWAVNAYLPALVARQLPDSRIAAFSSGNVYPFTSVAGDGPDESVAPAPVGEYGMSVLGRERMFEYFSRLQGTPLSLIRLNYATEMRYGVVMDIAHKVWQGEPVDVSMGHVNVIWQGDANAMALATLADAASPPFTINIAGREKLAVRDIAHQLGERMGRAPTFTGSESETALLSNGSLGWQRYGRPRFAASEVIDWSAQWLAQGGATMNKPTHFQVRDGQF